MSPARRLVAVAFAVVLGIVGVGLMRGEIPVGFRGSDEPIRGVPVIAMGVLAIAGACWVMYAAITAH